MLLLNWHLQPWQWLALSAVILALGPLVLAVAQRARGLLEAVDGFVLVAVGGLVAGDALPEAVEHGGWPVVVLAGLGFVGPTLLERWLHKAARAVHTAALGLGLAGLALHAGLDGAVLAQASGDTASNLAAAVLLHRLPEGLTVWWLLAPGYGARFAAAVLAAMVAATGAGLLLAGQLPSTSGGLGWVEALVSGSLLHVIVHRPHPILTKERSTSATFLGTWRLSAGLGGLLGLALLTRALPWDEASLSHRLAVLRELALDSAPALLFAYLAAGAVQSFLPAAGLQWMARGGNLQRACRGAAFGLPLPICSCGVVPVYRSLMVQGVPSAAGLAFLVATPELGLDAALLSLPLLGPTMTVARLVGAFAVAIVVGVVLGGSLDVGRLGRRVLPSGSGVVDKKPALPLSQRAHEALRFGFAEMVDHTGPWVLLGLAIAAAVEPALRDSTWLGLPPALQVPLWGLLGMPMYVCAAGATPLVAVLLAAGVSPGAGLAFLLTGPATNVLTLGVLAKLHGRRAALSFAVLMAGLSMLAGWLANALLLGKWTPKAGVLSDHDHGALGELALVALGALLMASFLRQGPRAFVAQVLDLSGGHDHGHDHHHGDDRGHHSQRARRYGLGHSGPRVRLKLPTPPPG